MPVSHEKNESLPSIPGGGNMTVLDLLKIELDLAMAYVGTTKISEIDRATVDMPGEW